MEKSGLNLTFAEKVKVYEIIRDSWEKIKEDKLPVRLTTKLVCEKIEFTVPQSSVGRIMREMRLTPLGMRGNRNVSGESTFKRVGRTELDVVRIDEAIERHEKRIAELEMALGRLADEIKFLKEPTVQDLFSISEGSDRKSATG